MLRPLNGWHGGLCDGDSLGVENDNRLSHSRARYFSPSRTCDLVLAELDLPYGTPSVSVLASCINCLSLKLRDEPRVAPYVIESCYSKIENLPWFIRILLTRVRSLHLAAFQIDHVIFHPSSKFCEILIEMAFVKMKRVQRASRCLLSNI